MLVSRLGRQLSEWLVVVVFVVGEFKFFYLAKWFAKHASQTKGDARDFLKSTQISNGQVSLFYLFYFNRNSHSHNVLFVGLCSRYQGVVGLCFLTRALAPLAFNTTGIVVAWFVDKKTNLFVVGVLYTCDF